MDLGTHQSLQSAAKAYTDAYDPLFIWIKNELWAHPKNGQIGEKAKLQEIHDKLQGMSRGRVTSLNKADFAEADAILRSAAFDAARNHSIVYSGLPTQRTIDGYILEARDDLLRDIVNASYAAATPAAAASITKRKLTDAASTFLARHDAVIGEAATALSNGGLASLTDQYMNPFRRGLKIIAGLPSQQAFNTVMVQSLEEGENVMRALAMAADKLARPAAAGSTVLGLEKAADDYRDTVMPVIGEIKQHHGGIAKQFGAARTP